MITSNSAICRRQFLSIFAIAFASPSVSVTKTLPLHNLNCTTPKFQLGQQVVHEWTVRETLDPRNGQTFQDFGVVVGLVWNPPDWNETGWVYFIRWTKVTSWNPPKLDET